MMLILIHPCHITFHLTIYYQQYPLHHVASLGMRDLVLELITNGSNINQRNYDGVTPLHEACVNGHYECVNILIQNGAEVNARNIDCSTPLCDAGASGNVEILKLLLEHGAEVNPQSNSFTPSPLHEAVLRRNAGCADILVNAGADTSAHDCHYGTPLHIACFNRSVECAGILLDAGADVCATKIHKAPLHYAAESGCLEMIQLLLDYMPNVYAKDNSNRVASKVALDNKHYDIWKLLRHTEENAGSLLVLCRQAIRKHVRYKDENVDLLPIPNRLQKYLYRSYNLSEK